MITAIALMLTFGQVASIPPVTRAEEALLQATLRRVAAVDEALFEMSKYRSELIKSDVLRLEQYRSLLLRFPGIQIDKNMTVDDMSEALLSYRKLHSEKAMPIVLRKQALAKRKYCDLFAAVMRDKAQLEQSSTYLSASLRDRIEMREAFDAFLRDETEATGVVCEG